MQLLRCSRVLHIPARFGPNLHRDCNLNEVEAEVEALQLSSLPFCRYEFILLTYSYTCTCRIGIIRQVHV